jgi:DNA-binding transcriptional ArsR family regulator
VIEALRWIEKPMSPAELANVLEDGTSLPTLSYHVRSLAELGILKLLEKERVGSVCGSGPTTSAKGSPQQLARGNLHRLRQPFQGRDTRIALARLDSRHLGRMHAAAMADLLLGQAQFFAGST